MTKQTHFPNCMCRAPCGGLDESVLTCHGAVMATRILFAVLALGLLVVAWAAWHGGQRIPAIGAAIIGIWMASLAAGGLRRRRN